MPQRHTLLQRQIRSSFAEPPAPSAEWTAFTTAVGTAYRQFDADHALLDRAMELSSRELLEANSDIRGVVQAFPDLFLWLTRDGTITACRGQACKDLVLPVDDLIGKRIHQGPDPTANAQLESALDTVNAGSRLVTVEYPLTIDGCERYFEARLLPLLEGRILAIVRDVTGRKANEQALARMVATLQATLESTTDGILVVDAHGKLVSFNRRLVQLLHIPEDVMERRSSDNNAIVDYVVGQLVDPEMYQARIREVYADPKAESFDEIVFIDGRIFERYSKPQILNDCGIGRVWSYRDVTGPRQAEAALRRSEEQLRQAQKMEAIGRLAGGVAHDFNNVLTAIIGFGELVLAGMPPKDPLRTKVQYMTTAASRGSELTQQLLAFSRHQVIAANAVDISTIIANHAPMMQRLIGGTIELVQRTHPGTGLVSVDPVKIEQILLNLAINARDAMPGGGRLVIETANVVLDEHYVTVNPGAVAGNYVMLAVSDSGSGMTREVQSKVFEPFFTTKEVGKGTGLGLSTVFGIVKQVGGHIGLYSEPGSGTVFKVYLPLASAAAAADTANPPESAPPRGGERILLVEDDDAVRLLAREVLTQGGYALVEASNGIDALALAERHQGFDLVVSDVIMPACGGRGLSEELRLKWPDIRILFMSGFTDGAIIDNGVLNEGVPFIQKPFRPDALLRKVREVLDAPVRGARAA